MRISAALCVCVLADGGCLGGSPVDLVGHVDLVGYVRVPCTARDVWTEQATKTAHNNRAKKDPGMPIKHTCAGAAARAAAVTLGHCTASTGGASEAF